MCGEVGLVGGQDGAQVSKILKFAEFGKGRWVIRADRDGKCRSAAKQTEEDAVVIIDKLFYLLLPQQYQLGWIIANQAMIPPDGYEARIFVLQRFIEPVVVLASLATSINEGSGKYIVIFHRGER